MLLEKINFINKLWEAYETSLTLDDNFEQLSKEFNLDSLNKAYADCIQELVEKDGRIQRKSLANLRASQQEVILIKSSSNEELKDYLSSLEKIGQLILELF